MKNFFKKWSAGLFVLAVLVGFWFVRQEIRDLKKEQRAYKRVYTVIDEKFDRTLPLFGGMPIPAELRNIPFADQEGIILDVKKISIPGVKAPYNPSIIEHGDTFRLFFRYDVLDKDCPRPYYSYIGCAELDEGLDLLDDKFVKIDTQSDFAEDPRVVNIGEDLFVVFNDWLDETSYTRGIHIANLNPDDLSTNYVTSLDLRRKPIEKNWMPFAYAKPGKKPNLHFVYDISPLKILNVADPTGHEQPVFYEITGSAINSFQWPEAWGLPRGGTPARRIGDEYLAFFHSSFRDRDGINWYIIAAYTFQGKPPFRATSISQYPILFKGAYDSPPLNTAHPCCRVLYPSGFAFENRNGKELIHLACGENDSAVKILTIDKEQLLKHMKRF
jgi:predicted GH43/DUF377 family glycosyl hydrolase